MDEFVLSAPGELGERQLLRRCTTAAARHPQVWPTTALAMADGQTRALSLAARIAGAPDELPLAVAELLSARILDPGPDAVPWGTHDAGTLLKIPTAWHGPITFFRPGEPFTPAESARAHRLAESRRNPGPPPLASFPQRSRLTHVSSSRCRSQPSKRHLLRPRRYEVSGLDEVNPRPGPAIIAGAAPQRRLNHTQRHLRWKGGVAGA